MKIINCTAALDAVAEPSLQPILDRYRDMMDLAVLYIIEPGDTLAALEAARERPFECWEFIDDHGGWFEAVFIICDDGAGNVILVPDREGIDTALLTLCRNNAEGATDSMT